MTAPRESSFAMASTRLPAMNTPIGPFPTYRCRSGVLERETTWTLTGDALERGEANAPPQRLPYGDIAEVRLIYDPTRFDTQRHRCTITGANRRRATITSTSYLSVGEFEDRGPAYAAFIRELIRRIAVVTPRCRFRAGKRPWVFFAEHLFLLAMLLLLVAVLAMVGEWSLPTLVSVKLAVIAGYLPIAYQYAKRNWPRAFTAGQVPPEVLP